MDREYDVFECFPDGSVLLRHTLLGLPNVRKKLQEVAETAENDHFAMCLRTREVVFRSASWRDGEIAQRVFQVAYKKPLLKARADVLRNRGYGVLSVLGNDAAKSLLDALQINGSHIALFMVGHGAQKSVREDMVAWLKARYPRVRILALNPPAEEIPIADFNAVQNGPEAWLGLVPST